MTDFWRAERIKRITDSASAEHVEVLDGPMGGFSHHPRRLIVSELAANRVADTLVAPDYDDMTDGFSWFPELGLRMFELTTGEDLPAKVDTLNSLVLGNLQPGDDAADAFVELDHSLFGAPKYHGDPADAPVPGNPWSQATTPMILEIGDPTVAVLDTGIALETEAGIRFSTDPDATDDDLLLPPGAVTPLLGSEAGHGTFIIGLVQRMSGGNVRVDPGRVLTPDGVGFDSTVSRELFELALAATPVQVINMSFGGYTRLDQMPPATAAALRALPATTIVVAAAGNGDDDCPPSDRKIWPAASPDIVAVGSLSEKGGGYRRSTFSNFGPWVDVWTLGEKLLSTYVHGDFPVDAGTSQPFAGWATWSGTSFSTALITAEISRMRDGRSGVETWQALRNDLHPVSEALLAPEAGVEGLVFDPRRDGIGIDPRDP